MVSGERFIVLGLAPVRSEWFKVVGRWANEAAIPVEFIRCISANEVMARLESGRPFSALMVDALAPGLDRDLFDAAASAGCARLVIDHGLVDRNWRELGASAVLPERFDPDELMGVLQQIAQPIGRGERPRAPTRDEDEDTSEANTGFVVAVTGAGGVGTSTVAMALAQGLSNRPERQRVLLADMALKASQAMMHDAGDVVPGLTELVESHRLGTPNADELESLIHSLPERGYHLLLGLRHERDWLTINARALDAAWESLTSIYATVITDVTADFDGAEETGANDLDDRNRLARSAIRRADLVVATAGPGAWGVHGVVRTILALGEAGVPSERVLPCVNRGPRQPRARAEIASAIASLLNARLADYAMLPSPIFIPEKRQVESLLRDGQPLPSALTTTISDAVHALLNRAPVDRRSPAPEPITPGTLGIGGAS